MRCASFFVLFVGCFVLVHVASGRTSRADSVILKNGQTIHGEATEADGRVTISFGERGWITIAASTVARIVEDELDEFRMAEDPAAAEAATASASEPVRVTTKPAGEDDEPIVYTGRVISTPDDRVVVLELPDGVRLRILRGQIESIEEIEEPAAAPAVEPAERIVRTSHIVTLENGRELRGTVVETPPEQPLELEVGQLGTVRIPRREVARIDAVEGVYEIPAPAEEATEPPAEETIEEIPLEEIKRRVREEVLRELLEDFIERKVDEALELGVSDISMEGIVAQLSPETILDVQFYVRELGRQRNQNRVRAETHLVGYGSAALPYLDAAASHPFPLTRRAVQRIVRDIGDVRGAPYAIDALDDDDVFVRELAGEALEALLDARVAYDASAPRARRLEAQRTYRAIWDGLRAGYLGELAAEAITG